MPDLDDRHWLRQAIELSRSCPPSSSAFCVGAIIVSPGGEILATGYSRETDPHDHAEEVALAKLPVDDPRLREATIYTSLEPCSKRASRPRTCTELILNAGIPRVVLAWREPTIFVNCEGVELLTAAGVEVIEFPDLAKEVEEINAHVLG
ncbi:deaminase [Kribbella sp. CA-245084]|uniref:deaminase n=1 Tax=Kribbella sp. CA-245084 TaxID=3239940 RepID=UPI003D8C4926